MRFRHPFKTSSFQSMLFFSFLFFSLFLIILLGVTSYTITNQEVVKETIRSRKILLNEINKQLLGQLQAIEYDSLAISSSPRVQRYLQYKEGSYEHVQLGSQVLDLLSRPSYIKETIHSIQLYAKGVTSGQQIDANGVFDYALIENYLWYDQIMNADNSWIGAHEIEVETYADGEKKVVTFARKVLSSSGNEIGILVMNIKLSSIQNIISGITGDSSYYVLDSNLRLITEIVQKPFETNSFNHFREKFVKVLNESEDGYYAISNFKEKELLIWNKQEHTQWITVDVIPWSNLTSGSQRIKQAIMISVALCIILATLMAYLMSKQFVKPIRKIIQVMNVVKTGNLDVQIKDKYHNEFGHLYEHFNHLIERVKQLLHEVEDQNRKKREAELRVLQAQINPHFIYNTLDIINWHSIEYGAHDISRMLSLLGKMLRIGLSKGAAFTSIKQELEHLHCYIELQKIRYLNKIQFRVVVEQSLEHYYVPKLIIQPFVENSLLHGLHAATEGLIEIFGIENENEIVFTIRDNGLGITTNVTKISDISNGGMQNVHERIQLYFGNEYGVHITSAYRQGTTVTIRLPKKTSYSIDQGEEEDV